MAGRALLRQSMRCGSVFPSPARLPGPLPARPRRSRPYVATLVLRRTLWRLDVFFDTRSPEQVVWQRLFARRRDLLRPVDEFSMRSLRKDAALRHPLGGRRPLWTPRVLSIRKYTSMQFGFFAQPVGGCTLDVTSRRRHAHRAVELSRYLQVKRVEYDSQPWSLSRMRPLREVNFRARQRTICRGFSRAVQRHAFSLAIQLLRARCSPMRGRSAVRWGARHVYPNRGIAMATTTYLSLSAALVADCHRQARFAGARRRRLRRSLGQ